VTVVHGDDQYSIDQTLARWFGQLGDPSMADLNTTRLEGRSMSENDLRTATGAMPFLAERRLVIVHDPLARLSSETTRNRFLDQLGRLAPTTSLVLMIDDQSGRKGEWEVIHSRHWLRKWVEQNPEQGRLIEFRLPKVGEMPGWIIQHARQRKGQISPPAAVELVKHIGNNTRLAMQEIEKLLTYVDFRRPVEVDDVIYLVAQAGEVDVFELVDALGTRNGGRALQLVQALLEKQDALSVLGLVVRHFRLLLLVREVIEEGGGPLVVIENLGREPFRITNKYYAEKLWGQARQFTLARLEDVYRRLLFIDEALKTSQMDGSTAFTTFIAELTT